MVGNDIVDLVEAKSASNWQRPRFLEKLFTKAEQELIYNSENKFLMVWRLWSMKEASYKLYTQQNPSRFYNPKGFECHIENENGTVRYNNFKCQTKTKYTSNYILSEARISDFKMTSKVIGLKSDITNIQSEIMKQTLLNEISTLFQVSILDLKFKKSELGIPSVIINSEEIPVSLSYHGSFGAYVI
ncbi:4'-phosphopantetheinyl transferase family protein [Winogradskyella bathintestinalis]|uniref:4'-phosphopantetheinyl transferase superfamily protein n=1 Tax=Winogradskyella bathintestinalis TaxID=3035208 RepID=A0ABT7ZR40_9FLAO|nr:4'-phosphopantetheinyl transferase superfamily protein [Winogradskyella bathintestinalis]MDN3491485.1 4'-phosphopantetheinyl transferase superfamily protein [Winogradskyella bathintestinalis]